MLVSIFRAFGLADTDDTNETLMMGTVAVIGVCLLILLIHVLVYGSLTMLYWNWFISPVFGWSKLNLAQGAGLMFFFELMKAGVGLSDFSPTKEKLLIMYVKLPLLYLATGFIVSRFV